MYRDRPFSWTRQASAAALLALFGTLLPAQRAAAQPQLGNLLPNPRLTVVTPCGGRAGASLELTFTGTELEEPRELWFSHPGIKATAEAPPPAPKPDPKKKPQPRRPRRGRPVPMTSPTKFRVTIDPGVPVGTYDVRLVTRWGISNPRAFVVGDQAEVMEAPKPHNDFGKSAQRVELNSTITGTISFPTDVDYYVFAGKKGQRVVVSCLASAIDSRLDPELRLFDGNGKELASNRQYNDRNALLDATLPEEGDYYVRLCQFTYTQGGPEYFYRLSITTAPWIDAVYPPVVEPGKKATVTVYGRNLPGGKPDESARVDGRPLDKLTVTIEAPKEPEALHRLAYHGRKAASSLSLNGFEYRLRNESGTSNPFLITFARAPVVLGSAGNNTPEKAQEVPVPCEVAGMVRKRRDRDWYTFTARKGEVLNIEVLSDRIGSPAAMYFLLRNPATKQDLVEMDTNQEALVRSFKFYMDTFDPGVYRFTAPADGRYQIMVASRTADTLAGPRYYYRLRITPPQPDFQVVVMAPDGYRPDTCSVRQGGNNFFTAYAWRHDGMKGDITLTAEGLPKGVTCPPQVLGEGVETTKVVVSAAPDAPEWNGAIRFKATATINGKPVVHEARYASITWPTNPGQNLPMFVRMDESLVLSVREKAPYKLTASVDKDSVPQGGKVTVTLKLDRLWPDFKGQVQIQPSQQDYRMRNNQILLNHPPVNIPPGKNDAKVTLNISGNAQPGTYNLVFRAFGPVPFNKDPNFKGNKPQINVVQPTTPVTLNILPKQLARVALNNQNPTIKVGKTAEVGIRVDRLFEYDGEYKVQLVLPPNVQGLQAEEITIPAGQNQAKLVIKVDPDAKPGFRGNLVLKTTALYRGKLPLVQQSKINVNVVK